MAYWGKDYWKATAERTLGTAAASAIGVLTVGAVSDIDWANTVSVVGLAGLIALLKCITANATTGNGPDFQRNDAFPPPGFKDRNTDKENPNDGRQEGFASGL